MATKNIIPGNQNITEFTSHPNWQMGVNAGLDYERLIRELLDSGINPKNIRVETYNCDDYSDFLFIKVGKTLPIKAAVAIAKANADQVSLSKNGWLTLWWD